MALGFAVLMWCVTCAALATFEAVWRREPAWLIATAGPWTELDDRQRLRSLANIGVCAIFCAVFREAVKSREHPYALRCGVLLIVFNLAGFLTDALNEPGGVPVLTQHMVATVLALLVNYTLSLIAVVSNFVRWRRAEQPFLLSRRDSLEPNGARRVRRVLIAYANVGSGHKMAALAIKAAIERRGVSGMDVQLLDAMDLCPAPFRYVMQTLFQEFTQSLAGQHILGFAYDSSDKGRAKAAFQRRMENFCLLPLVERISRMRPHVVVCTHFLPAQLLSGLRHRHISRTVRQRALALPIATVLTDLDLQYMWVQNVDRYFLPREDAGRMLEAYGGGAPLAGGSADASGHDYATVSGIPIDPAFLDKARDARQPDGAAERVSRRSELAAVGKWEGSGSADWPEPTDERPVVLFVSSGNAVGEIYAQLLKTRTPLRLLVCTGRQADVRASLEREPVPPRHAVKMLGFVKDAPPTPGGMPTLLRCADLFVRHRPTPTERDARASASILRRLVVLLAMEQVGKSGGLAIAEAAALRVPMIVLDPIPGQEQRNADVLLEAGAALKINDLPLLPFRVDDVLGNGASKARQMAAAIGALGRPDAAFVVADAVIGDRIVPPSRREDESGCGPPEFVAFGEEVSDKKHA